MRSQARTDEVATAPMISVLVIPLLPEDRELAGCTHFLIPAASEDIAAYLRRILLAEYAWNLEKDAFLGHIYTDVVFKVLMGKLRRQLERRRCNSSSDRLFLAFLPRKMLERCCEEEAAYGRVDAEGISWRLDTHGHLTDPSLLVSKRSLEKLAMRIAGGLELAVAVNGDAGTSLPRPLSRDSGRREALPR